MKAKVIPVIIGATGTISESLRQYLSNRPGKHEMKELQKNSHVGHCTHTAEGADISVQNILHGRNNTTRFIYIYTIYIIIIIYIYINSPNN